MEIWASLYIRLIFYISYMLNQFLFLSSTFQALVATQFSAQKIAFIME